METKENKSEKNSFWSSSDGHIIKEAASLTVALIIGAVVGGKLNRAQARKEALKLLNDVEDVKNEIEEIQEKVETKVEEEKENK